MTMPATWLPYATVHETHIGVVFLLGDRAYKFKKPVDLSFLDFSTTEARVAACHREVELNRRLAPDVYLGVAELSALDGTPPEPVVVMRRMPESLRLSTLVTEGADLRQVVEALARMMAVFHSGAGRSAEISAEAGRDAVRRRWCDSFAHVAALGVLDPDLLAEIERLTLGFLGGRAALFDRRAAEGRVVDGHGDLLARDIFCLDDGPRVLDCLEFDDHLRHVDGLDDIAFLAMDLEHLGAPALAQRLLDTYADFAGDPAPPALRHHYIAYRAFVRAKVACLRANQQNGDGTHEAREAVGEATAYAELALRHLRSGRPRLIVVGGLPGTGKSTVAGGIADHLGAVLLSSDRLRKELAARAPHQPASAEYLGGIYTTEHSGRTYAELLHRAGQLLTLGETVVLDASWVRTTDRTRAASTAREASSELIALRCKAPQDVAADRIRLRHNSMSDADPAIAAAMAAHADPWPEAHVIDTTTLPEESLAQALAALDH